MNKKLTPEEAWSHVKALWPDAEYIRKRDDTIRDDLVYRGPSLGKSPRLVGCEIDWPPGIYRYPPKEEWRDAEMPRDWGKEVRFSDDKRRWNEGKLCGFLESVERYPWLDELGAVYTYCQVRVTDGDKKQ